MSSGASRTFQFPDGLSTGVQDGNHHLTIATGTSLHPGARSTSVLLRIGNDGLRTKIVAQVVTNERPPRWLRRREHTGGPPLPSIGVVYGCRTNGEEMCGRGEHLAVQLLQRCNVRHDPHAPAVRAKHEIVLARVHDDVVDRDGRKVVLEAYPILPAIDGEVHADLVAQEEEVTAPWMFDDDVHGPAAGQTVRDCAPVATVVFADVRVRAVVVVPVTVERRVHRGLVELRW